MDYFGIVGEAWRLVRRERALWGLGAIEAAQGFCYLLFVVAATMPFTLLATYALPARSIPEFGVVLNSGLNAVAPYLPVYMAVLVALLALWIASAIVGLAATGGQITQVDAVARSEAASVRVGLADGLRSWWRVAAIWAIPVMPALVLVLVESIAFLVFVSRPLMAGQTPDLVGLTIASVWIGVALFLVVAAAVPLGVIAQLGLRSALLEDAEWRAAFSAGWRLVRAQPGRVAVMFLALMLVLYAAIYALELTGAAVLGIFVAIAIAVSFLSRALAVLLGVVILLAAVVGFYALSAGSAVVASTTWTLFWRAVTGRDRRFAAVSEPVAPADTRVGPSRVPMTPLAPGVPPAARTASVASVPRPQSEMREP